VPHRFLSIDSYQLPIRLEAGLAREKQFVTPPEIRIHQNPSKKFTGSPAKHRFIIHFQPVKKRSD
jgi:hypothetical protein